MSAEEVRAFLGEQMVMQCATNGPRGLPHMTPLWFVGDAAELRGWTYAKSQKARNLERDPRATLGIEDGVQYHELRGVMFECDVQVERDPVAVEKLRARAVRALRGRVERRHPGDGREPGPEARRPHVRSNSYCELGPP